jgi:hemoglobin
MTVRSTIAAILALAACGCRSGSSHTASEPSRDTVLASPEAPPPLPPPDHSGPTLYARLGGDQGIRALVDDLTDRVLLDSRINFDREGMPTEWQATPENVDRFKDGMARFIANNTGGPTSYRGREMRTVHRGMRISNAEFNALLQSAEESLKRFNIPELDRREFLAMLENHRQEIVEAG